MPQSIPTQDMLIGANEEISMLQTSLQGNETIEKLFEEEKKNL
jgi:hypothetical protein